MSANETENQYLTFVMNDENYAIGISNVREVLTVPRMTRIPRMPDFMRGVINLRGSVVPVLDLRMKFGLGLTSQTAETSIIVTEISDGAEDGSAIRLGVLADSVRKVCTILPENIEAAPKIGLSVDTAFIAGIGRIDEMFTVILDTREMLTRDDLRQMGALDDLDKGSEPDPTVK